MVGKDGGGQNLFLVKLFLLEVKLSLVPWILHDVNRLHKIEGLICGPHLVQCTLSPLLTPPPLPAPASGPLPTPPPLLPPCHGQQGVAEPAVFLVTVNSKVAVLPALEHPWKKVNRIQ